MRPCYPQGGYQSWSAPERCLLMVQTDMAGLANEMSVPEGKAEPAVAATDFRSDPGCVKTQKIETRRE
jgi:hypothetical protein